MSTYSAKMMHLLYGDSQPFSAKQHLENNSHSIPIIWIRRFRLEVVNNVHLQVSSTPVVNANNVHTFYNDILDLNKIVLLSVERPINRDVRGTRYKHTSTDR